MKLISNLDKMGKGIKKETRQKRDFAQFFSVMFYHFGTLLKCGIYAFIISLPFLSYGLAETGLCRITRSVCRDKHSFGISDMNETIKKNFKQSLIISFIDFIILAFLSFDFYIANFILSGKVTIAITFAVAIVGFVLFSFSRFYRQMLMITFNKKVGQIYRDSFALAIVGFKRNIVAGIVLTLMYGLAFLIAWYAGTIGFIIVVLLYIFFFRWFRSLLIQFTVFPVIKKYLFDPYYEKHPDEDLEKRYNLGLITADEYFGTDEDEEKINWDILFR